MALYAAAPSAGASGSVALFVALFCVILTMYGGGFATIPAYLADIFGTQMVGAIHGRLLTAWSVAGILGPVLVNYINDAQLKAGVPKSAAYDTTMYVLAALLAGGFVCNLLVRPLAAHWFMSEAELAAERQLAHDVPAPQLPSAENQGTPSTTLAVVGLWLVVALPLAWGIWNTVVKALVLLR
jgi:MFS family permease